MGKEARMMASAADDDKSGPMDFALEAVSHYGQNGLVHVPAKPTAQMLAAGARAGDVNVEVAFRVYVAMIKAAG